MSEAAGTDLTWYFDQALLQPGFPRIEVSWRRTGRQLKLDLRQVQPEGWGIRRIPGLEIEVDGRRMRVDVSGAQASATLDKNMKFLNQWDGNSGGPDDCEASEAVENN